MPPGARFRARPGLIAPPVIRVLFVRSLFASPPTATSSGPCPLRHVPLIDEAVQLLPQEFELRSSQASLIQWCTRRYPPARIFHPMAPIAVAEGLATNRALLLRWQ